MIRQVQTAGRQFNTALRACAWRGLSSGAGSKGVSDKLDEQVRNAMKDFFKNSGSGSSGADGSLWNKLEKQVNAPRNASPYKKPFNKDNRRPRKDIMDEATEGEGGSAPDDDVSATPNRGFNTRFNNNFRPNNRHRSSREEDGGQGMMKRRGGWRAHEDEMDEADTDVPARANKDAMFSGDYNDDDRDEDSDKDNRENDTELDPLERALLLDLDFFQEMVAKGVEGIDTSDMDPLDALAAEAFTGTMKLPEDQDPVYRAYFQNPLRTHVPAARSSLQLLYNMQFKCEADPASPGYEQAREAWQVVSRNMYYSDENKRTFTTHLAGIYNDFHRSAEKLEESYHLDNTLEDEFRPGLDYIEVERQREVMRMNVGSKKDSGAGEVGETNWAVEAVVDEDQL